MNSERQSTPAVPQWTILGDTYTHTFSLQPHFASPFLLTISQFSFHNIHFEVHVFRTSQHTLYEVLLIKRRIFLGESHGGKNQLLMFGDHTEGWE